MIEKIEFNGGYTSFSYDYDKDFFNVKHTAECIENGEEFECDFYTPHSMMKLELKAIGKYIASIYGGECINVR